MGGTAGPAMHLLQLLHANDTFHCIDTEVVDICYLLCQASVTQCMHVLARQSMTAGLCRHSSRSTNRPFQSSQALS